MNIQRAWMQLLFGDGTGWEYPLSSDGLKTNINGTDITVAVTDKLAPFVADRELVVTTIRLKLILTDPLSGAAIPCHVPINQGTVPCLLRKGDTFNFITG